MLDEMVFNLKKEWQQYESFKYRLEIKSKDEIYLIVGTNPDIYHVKTKLNYQTELYSDSRIKMIIEGMCKQLRHPQGKYGYTIYYAPKGSEFIYYDYDKTGFIIGLKKFEKWGANHFRNIHLVHSILLGMDIGLAERFFQLKKNTINKIFNEFINFICVAKYEMTLKEYKAQFNINCSLFSDDRLEQEVSKYLYYHKIEPYKYKKK